MSTSSAIAGYLLRCYLEIIIITTIIITIIYVVRSTIGLLGDSYASDYY